MENAGERMGGVGGALRLVRDVFTLCFYCLWMLLSVTFAILWFIWIVILDDGKKRQ